MKRLFLFLLICLYHGEIYSQDGQDSKPPIVVTPVVGQDSLPPLDEQFVGTQITPEEVQQYRKLKLKIAIADFYLQLEGRRQECKQWMGEEAIDADFISLSLQYSLSDSTHSKCTTCKNPKPISQLHPDKLICIFKDKKLQDLILNDILGNYIFDKNFDGLKAKDLVLVKKFYRNIIKDLRTYGP